MLHIYIGVSSNRPKKLDKDIRGKASGSWPVTCDYLSWPDPFLRNPRRGQPLRVDQRSANPRFGIMGTGFSNARGTAAIFPENFYREPVQPVKWTYVQVVTSWPPQFGSFLIPPSSPLFPSSLDAS